MSELGFVDACAPSLQHVRSGSFVCADALGEPGDLLTDFPFVEEEFLAVLLSIYSPLVLRSVLSNDRVQALEIWNDFSCEHGALGTSAAAEQLLFNEYSIRFANIVLSLQDCIVKTDAQRWTELQSTGRRLGLV